MRRRLFDQMLWCCDGMGWDADQAVGTRQHSTAAARAPLRGDPSQPSQEQPSRRDDRLID